MYAHIIKIGKGEAKVNIEDYLPNSPILGGNESIFKISWANARILLNSEIEYLIKGLHIIELEYRKIIKSEFGFGSPSPTFKLIKALVEIDENLAKELYNWVNHHGGNYYIPRTALITKEQEINKRKEFANEVKRKREIKKSQTQEEHRKVLTKQAQNKLKRTKLLKLTFEELINVIENDFQKPIHYYEESIMNIQNIIENDNQRKLLIDTLLNKYESRYPKMTTKLINKIKASDNQR